MQYWDALSSVDEAFPLHQLHMLTAQVGRAMLVRRATLLAGVAVTVAIFYSASFRRDTKAKRLPISHSDTAIIRSSNITICSYR